jgi:riboflavin kinase/FMN adenylyltransferase
MAGSLGFRVRIVPSVIVGGNKVSSTRVRALVQQGRVAAASQLLARPYQLAGDVVKGSGVGRQLGYPTANLQLPEEKLLPRDGVYACWAGRRRLWPAALYVGVRPTFDSQGIRRVEVHLLEHGRRPDLLGSRLKVELIALLRRDRKFASFDALKAQMARDCSRARQMLATLQG